MVSGKKSKQIIQSIKKNPPRMGEASWADVEDNEEAEEMF
jgi:hypothetical protein